MSFTEPTTDENQLMTFSDPIEIEQSDSQRGGAKKSGTNIAGLSSREFLSRCNSNGAEDPACDMFYYHAELQAFFTGIDMTTDYTKTDSNLKLFRKNTIEFFTNRLENTLKDIQHHSIFYQEFEEYCYQRCKASHRASERMIYEYATDVVRNFLEAWKREYKSHPSRTLVYPDVLEEDFQRKVMERPEFFKNKIPMMTFDSIDTNRTRGFRKSAMQTFVKNFLSPQTPYNGILLWHEVGVGKTCAGISIAENFRDYVQSNQKKILVLTPSETLITNWKDEIFNVEKEILKRTEKNTSNVQCTGDRYLQELGVFDPTQPEKMKREINKIVNKYYEFMGYQKLVNTIREDLKRLAASLSAGRSQSDESLPQRVILEYIEHRFSDTVVIMDEVHFTREGGSREDKLARPYLELIVRYAKNMKLVLATATPMYNITREIGWLLNLLLWNDKRGPVYEDDLFENDGITLKSHPDDTFEYQHTLDTLMRKSRGYLSYVRGENPFVFPIKLTPADLQDPNAYTPQPKKTLEKGKLVSVKSSDRIRNGDMIFYRDTLSEWQYKQLQRFVVKEERDREDGVPEEMSDDTTGSFSTRPVQASNIVYPTGSLDENGDDIGDIGEAGLNAAFEMENDRYSYRRYTRNIDGKGNSFLHRSQLATFSKKFHQILESITTCKGIVFVYSQFKASGVRGLALALEANGFKRYVGEPGKPYDNLLRERQTDLFCSHHLKYQSELTPEERPHFRQASYILLEGSVNKTQLNTLVKTARGEMGDRNTNGELIKVILGSKVTEQGISFKRVREIHIMEPWHHLNSMEQASGRGIRNLSHVELERSRRNVTLYLHIGAYPDAMASTESPDERIYRRAYWKKKKMTTVERLLKQNAVDCRMNKLGNMIVRSNYREAGLNPLEDVKLEDAKGVVLEKSLYDVDNTMRCDFQPCVYSCQNEDPVNLARATDRENTEFWMDEIGFVKDTIRQLYLDDFVYEETDIIRIVSEITGTRNTDMLYRSLYDLIDNKETIYDQYGREGYLIEREGMYIFQPSAYTGYEWMPMNYRIAPNLFKEKFMRVFGKGSLPISNMASATTTDTATVSHPEEEDTQSKEAVPMTSAKKPAKGEAGKQKKPSKAERDRETTAYVVSPEAYVPAYNLVERCKGIYAEHEQFIDTYFKEDVELFSRLRRNTETEWRVPTKDEILSYMFMSTIETEMEYPERIHLVLSTLVKAIKKKDELFTNLIIQYYDTPKTWPMILRNRRDMYERRGLVPPRTATDEIVGFMCFDPANHLDMWFYDKTADAMLKVPDNRLVEYQYLLPAKMPVENRNGLYGFVDARKQDPDFFIVNKEDGTYKTHFTDGKINKKMERNGAVCGHAMGAKYKQDLVVVINKLVGATKYDPSPDSKTPAKSRTLNTTGKTLCQEIEILLRHHDVHSPAVRQDYRFFYRRDELYAYKPRE